MSNSKAPQYWNDLNNIKLYLENSYETGKAAVIKTYILGIVNRAFETPPSPVPLLVEGREKEEGLRWAKAEDRLPEQEKSIFFEIAYPKGRVVKYAGFVTDMFDGSNFVAQAISFPMREYSDRIRWLEEIPSAPQRPVSDTGERPEASVTIGGLERNNASLVAEVDQYHQVLEMLFESYSDEWTNYQRDLARKALGRSPSSEALEAAARSKHSLSEVIDNQEVAELPGEIQQMIADNIYLTPIHPNCHDMDKQQIWDYALGQGAEDMYRCLQAEISSLKEDHHQLQGEYTALTHRMEEKCGEIASLKEKMARKDEEIEASDILLDERREQLADRDTQIELLRKNGASLRPGISILIARMRKTEGRFMEGDIVELLPGLVDVDYYQIYNGPSGNENAKFACSSVDITGAKCPGRTPQQEEDYRKAHAIAFAGYVQANISKSFASITAVYDQFIVDEANNIHKPITE